MSEVKVREFWIDPDSDDDDMSTFIAFRRHPRQGDLEWQESLIRVIEHSAYLELQKENEHLIEQCNMWGRDAKQSHIDAKRFQKENEELKARIGKLREALSEDGYKNPRG